MKQKRITTYTPEWYMMIFVICIWAYQPLIFNVSVLANKFVGSFFDIVFYAFMVFVFFKAHSIWKKKIKSNDIIFYFLCVLLLVLSIALFPNSAEPIKDKILPFIFQVLPLFFVGLFIDIDKQKDMIFLASALCIISQVIYFFFFIQRLYGGVELMGDLIMPATYTLPHALVVIWYTLKKINFINVFLSVLSIVLLLSFSNRGSLLAVILFIIVHFLFLNSSKSKVVTRFIVVLVAGIALLFFNQIIELVNNLFQNFGLSTSVLERMFNGELADSNGRDEIYTKAVQHISNNLFGSGVGIDRLLFGTDSYVHNFVLEIIMDFGVIIGSILVIAYVSLILIAFRKAPSLDSKTFIVVLCGRGLIHLFFSGSYIEDGHFFLLVGFCITALRQSRKRNQSSTSMTGFNAEEKYTSIQC